MRKWLRTCGMAVLVVLAAGCWDRTEIEERGFVVGSALDAGDDGKVMLTFQFANPSALHSTDSASKPGGKTYSNLSVTANTVFKAARQMSNVFSRSPYLEHNRIILISESLARRGDLGDVLDVFFRDSETRRAAKVMIAEGEARQLLEATTPVEALPVRYIEKTSENPDKSESISPPTNIGNVHAFLLQDTSFAVPKIALAAENAVATSGAAVFNGHDHRLRGFLNEAETTGRNFILGSLNAGALEIKLNDAFVVFEMKHVARTLEADVSDPRRPVFHVSVMADGNIGESHLNASLLNKAVLAEAEKKIEEKIESLTRIVAEKAQKEYRSDIFEFGKHLYREHYGVWQQIKDDWDSGENLFSGCTIRVEAKVRLHVVGSIQKAE
ncbi:MULTISPECIES: Ger(x)C family spore germination protein [Cohnella]|uniref:Ger(x)C family spore germination protein n=1 Tax=Cohnella TaxID=329857 RepID=UPI0009BB9521|nr:MULTISPECIES: Ger(x)C family spore germination protein [Cohnella]MBN2982943.1 Ger(x)C family spore germination protein [Cohnella algarum]